MLIRNAQVSGQDITIYETDKGDFWCAGETGKE